MDNSKNHSPIDLTKLSILDIFRLVPVGQLWSVIATLIVTGVAIGSFQSGMSHSIDMQTIQTELSQCKFRDRLGPFGSLPTDPIAILTRGNELYSATELEKSLMVYRTVEYIDRHGNKPATDSIYATISTVTRMLADRSADPAQKSLLMADSVKYKHASVLATRCQKGDCAESIKFWNIQSVAR